MTDDSDLEETERLELEQWLSAQPAPPTIFDVFESGNTQIIAAYITAAFRQAAAEAVEEDKRAARVRAAAIAKYGDPVEAEVFLRSKNPSLEGRDPLRHAVASEERARLVLNLIADATPKRSPRP